MISLRPATLADLDVLRHWDQQPHVVASDPNDDWAWDVELGRCPDWREQLIAELDDRPVGFVQIIDPQREELALARCFAEPSVSAVLIDPLGSNTRAHRFYERLGFRFLERRHFGEDDCFVYRLDRAGYTRTASATSAADRDDLDRTTGGEP